MRVIPFVVSFAFVTSVFTGLVNTTDAAESWVSPKKAWSTAKRERRDGRIPTIIKCRNKGGNKTHLKPEVKFIWKDNVSDIQWAIILHSDLKNWEPVQKSTGKPWRRVSAGKFSIPTSGKSFNCTLWYNKHLKASNNNDWKYISAPTNDGGYVSKKLN